jgi:SAM-dependent methyltransferase
MDHLANPTPRYHEARYYAYQTAARGLLTADRLKSEFEALAEYYWYGLRDYLPADKEQMCLDLPCGYGNFLYFLKKHGYRNCRGYDLDPRQVELARSLDLPAEWGEAFDVLANISEPVSLIACIDFIEHLEKSAAVRFLEACYQAMPAGGTLILRVPSADGPFGAHDVCNDITHAWGVTSNALCCLLNMVGFASVRILDFPNAHPRRGILSAARWMACRISRWIAGVCLRVMCIGAPAVWGRSMWAIATK